MVLHSQSLCDPWNTLWGCRAWWDVTKRERRGTMMLQSLSSVNCSMRTIGAWGLSERTRITACIGVLQLKCGCSALVSGGTVTTTHAVCRPQGGSPRGCGMTLRRLSVGHQCNAGTSTPRRNGTRSTVLMDQRGTPAKRKPSTQPPWSSTLQWQSAGGQAGWAKPSSGC